MGHNTTTRLQNICMSFITYQKKDYKRIRQVTKLILFVISIFSIFLTIVFILFANEISLFIYKNIETGLYIKILSHILIFMYLDIVIDSILKGLDDQFNVMIVNVIDLLVSVIFIYFFVPKLGFTGYILSIYKISSYFPLSISSTSVT